MCTFSISAASIAATDADDDLHRLPFTSAEHYGSSCQKGVT